MTANETFQPAAAAASTRDVTSFCPISFGVGCTDAFLTLPAGGTTVVPNSFRKPIARRFRSTSVGRGRFLDRRTVLVYGRGPD